MTILTLHPHVWRSNCIWGNFALSISWCFWTPLRTRVWRWIRDRPRIRAARALNSDRANTPSKRARSKVVSLFRRINHCNHLRYYFFGFDDHFAFCSSDQMNEFGRELGTQNRSATSIKEYTNTRKTTEQRLLITRGRDVTTIIHSQHWSRVCPVLNVYKV